MYLFIPLTFEIQSMLFVVFLLIASRLGFAPRTDLDSYTHPPTQHQASFITSLLSGMEARCLMQDTHLAQRKSELLFAKIRNNCCTLQRSGVQMASGTSG